MFEQSLKIHLIWEKSSLQSSLVTSHMVFPSEPPSICPVLKSHVSFSLCYLSLLHSSVPSLLSYHLPCNRKFWYDQSDYIRALQWEAAEKRKTGYREVRTAIKSCFPLLHYLSHFTFFPRHTNMSTLSSLQVPTQQWGSHRWSFTCKKFIRTWAWTVWGPSCRELLFWFFSATVRLFVSCTTLKTSWNLVHLSSMAKGFVLLEIGLAKWLHSASYRVASKASFTYSYEIQHTHKSCQDAQKSLLNPPTNPTEGWPFLILWSFLAIFTPPTFAN